MTTSGTATFNPVRDQIVNGALRLVGAYNSTDQPRPEQTADALEALNMLLKSFQVEGFLWLKEFATLTLVASQAVYDIPGVGCSATSRPTRIHFPCRVDSDGYSIPMGDNGKTISREEYTAIPNKTSEGTPLKVFYDPQMEVGKLYLWPVPVDTTYSLTFTCDRIIEDILDDENTFDLPPEQVRRLKYALALEIATEYALSGPDFDRLAARYKTISDALSNYDREVADTQLQPWRR